MRAADFATERFYTLELTPLSASRVSLIITIWYIYAGNITSKELQTFAMASFPDIVTRITGSNIDSAFGATMTQPKLVLFTDKEDTPGMFRALAASFRKYHLHFFTIHSGDKQALKQFSITKVGAAAQVPPICFCVSCTEQCPIFK